MKIEVNEFYLMKNGEINEFVKEDNFDCIYYSKIGSDVVAHIPKELHYELIRRIQMYYKKDNYKRYVKRNYEKKVH